MPGRSGSVENQPGRLHGGSSRWRSVDPRARLGAVGSTSSTAPRGDFERERAEPLDQGRNRPGCDPVQDQADAERGRGIARAGSLPWLVASLLRPQAPAGDQIHGEGAEPVAPFVVRSGDRFQPGLAVPSGGGPQRARAIVGLEAVAIPSSIHARPGSDRPVRQPVAGSVTTGRP
jgi:hypothetical protein